MPARFSPFATLCSAHDPHSSKSAIRCDAGMSDRLEPSESFVAVIFNVGSRMLRDHVAGQRHAQAAMQLRSIPEHVSACLWWLLVLVRTFAPRTETTHEADAFSHGLQSPEDIELRDKLALMVERTKDADQAVAKAALETMK